MDVGKRMHLQRLEWRGDLGALDLAERAQSIRLWTSTPDLDWII